MTGKIFISYRRGDDPGYTQALYQRLEDEFTSDRLFMDIEGSIKPGDDFVQVLDQQVSECDVLLAVIGPRWAELLSARRGDPDDFVVIEIKAALSQAKRVIPVLVGGAEMPRADTLQEAIQHLARRNAVGLRPERFKADCQGLITALQEQLAVIDRERAARSEAERAAAEVERLKREAEDAARIAAAEERARLQKATGLSAEEIQKAEELANWEYVSELGEPQAVRDHLARFPGSVTSAYALARLEELAWARLGQSPDSASIRAFLDEFPEGANAGKARARLTEMERQEADANQVKELRARETEEWAEVAAGTSIAAIKAFLDRWPDGRHARAAQTRIAELTKPRSALRPSFFVWSTLSVGVALILNGLIEPFVGKGPVALVFSLAVLVSAVFWGRWPAINASILASVVYNFFFLPPIYSFTIVDPVNFALIFMFLVTALTTSGLAGRLGEQLAIAVERTRATRRLFEVSRRFSALASIDDIAEAAAEEIYRALDRAITILILRNEELTLHAAVPAGVTIDPPSKVAAQRLLSEVASFRLDNDGYPWQFVPLRTADGPLGVIGIAKGNSIKPLDAEQQAMLESIAEQSALALARASLAKEIVTTRTLASAERSRNVWLASIASELRTALDSLLGTAASISKKKDVLDTKIQEELSGIQRTVEEVDTMIRNTLATIRIELRRNWIDLCVIVERLAKVHLTGAADHQIHLMLPPKLPLVRGDADLIEQAVALIVTHVAQTAGQGAVITIEAVATEDRLVLSFSDDGPPSDLISYDTSLIHLLVRAACRLQKPWELSTLPANSRWPKL
jgi:signal transduction histidine kinase